MRPELRLRALSFALALAVVATRARAESVVLLSEGARAAELFGALELELRGYGPLLLMGRAPEGESEGARRASAGRLAIAAAASLSVWVERAPPERVRVLVAQLDRLLEAPLPEPLSGIEPRVFASIAASLVLEALHPQPVAARPPGAGSVGELAPHASQHPPRPRFFARASFVYGVARVGKGHKADRPPSTALGTSAGCMRARFMHARAELARHLRAQREGEHDG